MKSCLQRAGPGPLERATFPKGLWEVPPRVRVSEWTHQLPVLRIGLGWGLGALLLVHGAQELLHIRRQQVIHFVALDREGWGWRL